MREREMRERVERFLETRLRSMLLPATLGLGLAVGACNSGGLGVDDGGDKVVNKDAASPATKYMAQIPDAGPDLPALAPVYMAQVSDAGAVARYMGPQPIYMAQLPRS